MRYLIDNYRNLTAGHCGSGAMRNLLYHYCDLELPEGVVFGLGAGIDSVYLPIAGAEPPFMLFGRGSSMEADLAETLGIDYRETVQADNAQAWQDVKAEILAGRPTMLSGDIYYLDYREFKVHFPAHRFVLLGFDEERGEVYIADRTEEAIQTCSMAALALSRNPPSAISTHNNWGKFHSTRVEHDLAAACEIALKKTVERMLGIDQSQLAKMATMQAGAAQSPATGLKGLRTFCDAFVQWETLDNPSSHLQYVDNAIIKFGTGGGFFRDHFAEFMHWALEQRPDLISSTTVKLAVSAAAQWNRLSPSLQALAEHTDNRALWAQAHEQTMDIYETEYSLFSHLADTVL